jgi:hypothetical protein
VREVKEVKEVAEVEEADSQQPAANSKESFSLLTVGCRLQALGCL